MGYESALNKAWSELSGLTDTKRVSIRMFFDEYEVDLENRRALSLSCNSQPKDHIIIILLHYLIQKLKLKILPELTGEWIDFRCLEGGEAYYPIFKKRTIEIILRKYGRHPEALFEVAQRFPAKKAQFADISLVIEAFEEVPILVTLYKADEEFDAVADILFDKNINKIFCTEDIVVLADILVHLL